jgi:biotin carboxylase
MTSQTKNTAQNFIVIGLCRAIVLQVLLGVHAFANARCLAVCNIGTRFLRHSTLCSEYHETRFDGADDDALVERINRFCDEAGGATLIPADCDAIRLVDRLRSRVKAFIIPSPTAAQVDLFENKWRFYEFCNEYGLHAPSSRFVADKHALDYEDTAAALGLPFIVKPLDEDASRGIHIISSKQQYEREIRDDPGYRYAPLIVQRYIKGADIDLNLLAAQGQVRAFSVQQRIHPASEASPIKFLANQYLEHVAHVVAEQYGYAGVMHIDARIEQDSGDIYLFESNPRFWRSHSASIWCGLNFVELAASRAPGQETKTVTEGIADTYAHPLFSPRLLPHAFFGRGQRRRFARAMLFDICNLSISTRIAMVKPIKPVRRFIHALRVKL